MRQRPLVWCRYFFSWSRLGNGGWVRSPCCPGCFNDGVVFDRTWPGSLLGAISPVPTSTLRRYIHPRRSGPQVLLFVGSTQHSWSPFRPQALKREGGLHLDPTGPATLGYKGCRPLGQGRLGRRVGKSVRMAGLPHLDTSLPGKGGGCQVLGRSQGC